MSVSRGLGLGSLQRAALANEQMEFAWQTLANGAPCSLAAGSVSSKDVCGMLIPVTSSDIGSTCLTCVYQQSNSLKQLNT